jgi:hypothetical protein
MPQHAAARRRTAPVHPRRLSGPVRRPAPVGPPVRGRTGAFERLSRLPDHYVVDRLLRGRVCIWVIGIMLGGIVAMQVSLLRLNAGISRAVQTQSTLELKNASLQAAIAEQTSGDRLRAAAAAEGMVDPPAGDTRYLRARPATDPRRALRRMKRPSERAQSVVANRGLLPPALGGEPSTTVADPTGTPLPGATAAVAPTATVAPVPAATAVPTATAAPPVTADPATGATTAPTG